MRDPLQRVACPFCGSAGSGRYHPGTRKFTCVSVGCSRCCEVVDYSEFIAKVDQQTEAFFDAFPGLAPGSSRLRVREIGRDLLLRGVHPELALELVAGWNEVFARPPMGAAQLVAEVDQAAGRLRRGIAA